MGESFVYYRFQICCIRRITRWSLSLKNNRTECLCIVQIPKTSTPDISNIAHHAGIGVMRAMVPKRKRILAKITRITNGIAII